MESQSEIRLHLTCRPISSATADDLAGRLCASWPVRTARRPCAVGQRRSHCQRPSRQRAGCRVWRAGACRPLPSQRPAIVKAWMPCCCPLLRPLLIKLGALLGVLAHGLGALYAVRQTLCPIGSKHSRSCKPPGPTG